MFRVLFLSFLAMVSAFGPQRMGVRQSSSLMMKNDGMKVALAGEC